MPISNIKPKIRLSNWSQNQQGNSFVTRPEKYHLLRIGNYPTIARGSGRTCGDANLNSENHVILMERLNRFISFDPKQGLLRAEAGAIIGDILKTFIPRGWTLPSLPHTKYRTLGGCIATDAQGKNHFSVGNFSESVREIDLLVADGTFVRCSPLENTEIFWATVGGLGLTGIITEVTIQLVPISSSFFSVTKQEAQDLDSLLERLNHATENYAWGWIDCRSSRLKLGRGIVTRAEPASLQQLPSSIIRPLEYSPKQLMSMPTALPHWLMNSWTTKAWNASYYYWKKQYLQPFLKPFDSVVFPLDRIGKWNRFYGKQGFFHYECVIPEKQARQGIVTLIQELTHSKRASTYVKIYRMGSEGQGLLTFPMPGIGLECHLPMGDDEIYHLLVRLDALVLHYGGRVQLANDSRLHPHYFQAMYPRYPQWRAVKSNIDPQHRFSSNLSTRLGIEGNR